MLENDWNRDKRRPKRKVEKRWKNIMSRVNA
jgi:hypothetical protein